MSTVDTQPPRTEASVTPLTVSVVVLSKDEPELAETLTMLAAQCRSVGAECIVVDASEGRLDHIRDEFTWVRWIAFSPPLDTPTSIPHQRNVGVRAATGAVIAFIDAGCKPTAGWLAALTEPITKGREQATCGPITSSKPGVYDIINDYAEGASVEAAPTANLAFTREIFDRLDGFDQRFWYGSDVDFTGRIHETGATTRQVRVAAMEMQFGGSGLQRKRSWRYGRARARLLRLHPHRMRRELAARPEYLIYPLWLLALPVIALASLAFWWVLPAWVSLLALPYWRNRRASSPLMVITDHLIQGAAILAELAWAASRPTAPFVLHAPKDPGPYQPLLIDSLEQTGLASGYLRHWSRSQTIGLVLAPLQLATLRLRGTRIIHLHWTWGFRPAWASSRLARKLFRAWFGLYLATAKALGFRIIWTAHNIMPHTPVFDDDVAARRTLVRHADLVIAHNQYAADQLRYRFGAERLAIIPQGSTMPADRDRTRIRESIELEAREHYLVFLGKIERYKGLDLFLAELVERYRNGEVLAPFTLGIVGGATDHELSTEITASLDELEAAGCNVIRFTGRVPEETYWDHATAADLAFFPFSSITNSGSLLGALSAGTPVVTFDLPELADLPDGIVTKLAVGEMAHFVERAFELLAATTEATRDVATEYAQSRPWSIAARSTQDAYRRALKGGAHE